jgi:hypothetical protein
VVEHPAFSSKAGQKRHYREVNVVDHFYYQATIKRRASHTRTGSATQNCHTDDFIAYVGSKLKCL